MGRKGCWDGYWDRQMYKVTDIPEEKLARWCTQVIDRERGTEGEVKEWVEKGAGMGIGTDRCTK